MDLHLHHWVNVYNRRTAVAGQLGQPPGETVLYSIDVVRLAKLFSVRGSKCWNCLPIELRESTSYLSFKTTLKRWIQTNHNCNHQQLVHLIIALGGSCAHVGNKVEQNGPARLRKQ
ncbi:hypothetical protein PFLUV_G00026990 [Perca fluviatilis]|uniref:Uncharacterized protein n=1 Tax=Perca fluviatilis TaxID=8168 RepID=A0A6A5FHB2_PERFL|nr:hypothetical protein PFLUV_G00026990 [Perca fluviatilis]